MTNALANFDFTPVNFEIASMTVPCGRFEYDDESEFTVALEVFSPTVAEVQVHGLTMHHALEDYADDDRFVAQLAHHVGQIVRVDGLKLELNVVLDHNDRIIFDFAQ